MFPPATKILIVDDMAGMRKLIKSQLSEMGYRNVFQAEDGQQALVDILKQVEENAPYQIILSDWNMPVMTGIDLLKRIREMPGMEELPFLLITAENEFPQVKEAISFGVTEYIVKPFTPAVLKAKFFSVFKRQTNR